MKDQVINIVSRVLDMSVDNVSEKLAAENVENWDSLRHMRLILSLEEEFSIRFTEKEIVSLDSVSKIINSLKAREGGRDL